MGMAWQERRAVLRVIAEALCAMLPCPLGPQHSGSLVVDRLLASVLIPAHFEGLSAA